MGAHTILMTDGTVGGHGYAPPKAIAKNDATLEATIQMNEQ